MIGVVIFLDSLWLCRFIIFDRSGSSVVFVEVLSTFLSVEGQIVNVIGTQGIKIHY